MTDWESLADSADLLRKQAKENPKPAKRIKADANGWEELRSRKLTFCRLCGEGAPISLHHLVSKSLGGDDVVENLVCLCGSGTTGCHGLIERRDPWACSLLGRRLTRAEREYVIGKKGAYYLEQRYGLKEDAA